MTAIGIAILRDGLLGSQIVVLAAFGTKVALVVRALPARLRRRFMIVPVAWLAGGLLAALAGVSGKLDIQVSAFVISLCNLALVFETPIPRRLRLRTTIRIKKT